MRGWALSAFVLVIVLVAPVFAQVQTVGDMSFAVPEGWTYQGTADGGLMLLKQDQSFWILTVHAPRPTTGDQNADFKNAWRSVVLPVPDFQNSLPGYDPYSISNKVLGYPGKYYDGWNASGKMYARLYILETGKMVVPVMVLTPNRQVLDALNHIVEAVVGSVRVAPLKASPIRNTLTMADLPGEWHTGSAFSQTYYDRYSGAYAGSSNTAYSARYQITGNGSYTYDMGGIWNNRPVQDKDTGTVELGGGFITFKGRNHTSRYHFLNLQTAIDGSTVMMVLAGEEDLSKAAAFQEQWVRDAKK
jgi:hypothetical protein